MMQWESSWAMESIKYEIIDDGIACYEYGMDLFEIIKDVWISPQPVHKQEKVLFNAILILWNVGSKQSVWPGPSFIGLFKGRVHLW